MRLKPALLKLDATVVNIELTLTSIIQGVALTFLAENARTALSFRDAEAWPYVGAALLIIFIFWSRSILHTLTLIRWPLEFGHNFLYIICTLAECLLFTRLTNPERWFDLCVLYALLVWILFIYDLRMTKLRDERRTDARQHLRAMIVHDQWLNIVLLIPLLLVFFVAGAYAIHARPQFFLQERGHLWLIGGQIVGLIVYLAYVIRFFTRLAPLIATRHEERRALAAENAPES